MGGQLQTKTGNAVTTGSKAFNAAIQDGANSGANQRCNGGADKGAVESDCGEAVCIPNTSAASVGSKIAWSKQFGTCPEDGLSALVVSGTSIVAAGFSKGSLGFANQGNTDITLKQYTNTGASGWTRLLGSTSNEAAAAIATDPSGNFVIAGSTDGLLPGASGMNLGGRDAFVAKYDASGNKLWVRQLGTWKNDYFAAVATDSAGNIWAAGQTFGSLTTPSVDLGQYPDAILAKYSPSGTLLFSNQYGTANNPNFFTAITLDSSDNVYVTGCTQITHMFDVGVWKFSAAGASLWTSGYGFPEPTWGSAIKFDNSGNLWVGYSYDITTQSCLQTVCSIPDPVYGCDLFRMPCYDLATTVATYFNKFNPANGADLSTNGPIYSGPYRLTGFAFAPGDGGTMYASGYGRESQALMSRYPAGEEDLVVSRYELNQIDAGTAYWDSTWPATWMSWSGTSGHCPQMETFGGIAIDGTGNPYAAGTTCGPLFTTNFGSADDILAKYSNTLP